MSRIWTNNLYVGLLVNVTGAEDGTIYYSPSNQCILFKREEYWSVNEEVWDFIALDVLTEKKYAFVQGNRNDHLIRHSVGGCAVKEYFPIEKYLDYPRRTISRRNLQLLYQRLNHTTSKDDDFLQTIIDTINKVKGSSIDFQKKEDLIKELELLKDHYVRSLDQLKSGDNNFSIKPFESVYDIRMYYIYKLVELDQKFNEIKHEESAATPKRLMCEKTF